eukprot:COSAG06_NODE_1623_length_8895_cov_86.951683_13_plen_91_part_00
MRKTEKRGAGRFFAGDDPPQGDITGATNACFFVCATLYSKRDHFTKTGTEQTQETLCFFVAGLLRVEGFTMRHLNERQVRVPHFCSTLWL